MTQEVDEILSMWKAVKMLSPFFLAIASSVGSLTVYYLREMSKSMRTVCEALVRVETIIQHHDERLDKLESHCPLLKGLR